jgi:CTP synthase (UTP-ammonia lyase)
VHQFLNQQNIYESLTLWEFSSYYNIKNSKLSKFCKQKIIRFVNYNKRKDIENWSREQVLLYSPFKKFDSSLLGTNVTWHDAYCQVKENISTIRSKFNYNMQNKHTNEKNDDMNLKSKSSHPQNI